ncbi:hypothetical protein BDV96DRAFT_153970 [Lophiotrema nucula]|uniref:F-box domain-containing protein n=1 Tax=Lophiotrema nucula TaxID=690887 RepID=A0A6A5Z2M2_9PLEO|nr:hypothetical protein BDV96DRAFT_153970 [Lophiotrema nucula]
MAKSTPKLLTLPPELLVEIADYLPVDGIVAFQLSQRYLNSLIKGTPKLSRNRPLTDCAGRAIRTYLKPPSANNPPRLRCIVCRNYYPIAQFDASDSAACLSVPQFTTTTESLKEILEVPGRICSWHVGRFVRLRHTGPGGRNEWVSCIRQLCVHCGEIKGWVPCSCECESCGTRTLWTYTRYLNNNKECKTYKFWRRNEASTDSVKDSLPGSLFVRETVCEDGK